MIEYFYFWNNRKEGLKDILFIQVHSSTVHNTRVMDEWTKCSPYMQWNINLKWKEILMCAMTLWAELCPFKIQTLQP